MNKILSIIQVLVPLVALLALGIGMLRGKRAGMPAIQFAQKIMAGLIVLTLIVGAVAASKFGWLAFALLTVSGLTVASAMLLGAYLGVKLRERPDTT